MADENNDKTRFDGLDLVEARGFGYSKEEENSWTSLAQKSIDNGWKSIDHYLIQQLFKNDVDNSYYNIASIEFNDVDSSTSWIAKFVNDKYLWKLSIKNSPKAEVLQEDKVDFFKSQPFKDIATKIADDIARAKDKIDEIMMKHINNGEMLDVDEVKLSAILYWLSDKHFMENFRTGKFMQ